jgi:hypothetical protein
MSEVTSVPDTLFLYSLNLLAVTSECSVVAVFVAVDLQALSDTQCGVLVWCHSGSSAVPGIALSRYLKTILARTAFLFAAYDIITLTSVAWGFVICRTFVLYV